MARTKTTARRKSAQRFSTGSSTSVATRRQNREAQARRYVRRVDQGKYTKARNRVEGLDDYYDCVVNNTVSEIRKSPCVEELLAQENRRGQPGTPRGNPRIAKSRGPGKKAGFANMSKDELCKHAASKNCRIDPADRRKKRAKLRPWGAASSRGTDAVAITLPSKSGTQLTVPSAQDLLSLSKSISKSKSESESKSKSRTKSTHKMSKDTRNLIDAYLNLKNDELVDIVDITSLRTELEKKLGQLEALKKAGNPQKVQGIDQGIREIKKALKEPSLQKISNLSDELLSMDSDLFNF